jgi:hypothetical protein
MSDKVVDLAELKNISAEKLLKLPQNSAEKLFNNLSTDKKVELVISAPFKDRIDLILMSDDSKALVQALPEEEVYWTIKERGRTDSLSIISRTSHEQFQYLIDVDCWNRDEIDFNNIAEWYLLLGKCNEVKVVEWFEKADERFLISTLKRFMGIAKIESEADILEEYENMPNDTLDNVYYFQFADDESKQVLMPLLNVLYKYDSSLFYSLVEGILYDFIAEADEEAFRWRQVRISEKGFPVIDEALEVYQYVADRDIEALKKKFNNQSELNRESRTSFRYLLAVENAPSFFSSTIKNISDDNDLHDIQKYIINLANKIIMADCLEIRELEDKKKAIEKAEGYINIGLELISEEDISKAADVLASVHPLELFRIGYSSGLKLKNKLKEYIIKHGEQILSFTDVACSEVMSGLLEKRPKYFEGLKEKGSITLRDFKNISEIKYTDDAVNGLIFSVKLIFECFELDQEYLAGAFQDKVQNNSASITYISLFNTMLVNNICKGASDPEPLAGEDVGSFIKTAFDNNNGVISFKKGFKDEVFDWINNRLNPEKQDLSVLKRFVEQALEMLNEDLNSFFANDTIDSRYISALLFKKN